MMATRVTPGTLRSAPHGVAEPRSRSVVSTWDSDERRALRASARRFTESEIVPNLAAWEDAGAVPRALHRAAAAADLLGVGFPESAGGSGGSPVDAMVVAGGDIQTGGPSRLLAGLFPHRLRPPHPL